MADQDMRGWALKGAEQRLLEIAQEAKVIYAAFPELRDQAPRAPTEGGTRRRGRPAKNESSGDAPTGPRRRRRKMSKEARRKISEAQKARWAKQNGQSPAPASSARQAETDKKKRTMSAAARRKIGAAQRRRWRAQKAAGKSSSSTKTSK